MKLLIIALFVVCCFSGVIDAYCHQDLLKHQTSLIEIVIRTSTSKASEIVAQINLARSKLLEDPDIKFLDSSYYVKGGIYTYTMIELWSHPRSL